MERCDCICPLLLPALKPVRRGCKEHYFVSTFYAESWQVHACSFSFSIGWIVDWMLWPCPPCKDLLIQPSTPPVCRLTAKPLLFNLSLVITLKWLKITAVWRRPALLQIPGISSVLHTFFMCQKHTHTSADRQPKPLQLTMWNIEMMASVFLPLSCNQCT